MDIIDEINQFVVGTTYDESLSSLLKKVMDSQLSEEPTPKNYFYVTQVTNPAQTYFTRFHPEVKKSPETARKLAYGKQLHNFASIWFKNLPGYMAEEGLVDGAWVGIPGVRGKIDHRVGESLLEFKTKDSIPSTPEEIISNYPQDLEQLAFYSAMHPSHPKNNYLVFMKNSVPFDIKAFKIEINDNGVIKSILHSRITNLNKAIDTKDPSKLGKCRYFDTGCQYQEKNICSCAEFSPIKTDALQKALALTFDENFTKELVQAREMSAIPRVFSLSIRDIIAPRKHYMETIACLESSYNSDDIDEFKACLWSSIRLMKKHNEIDLNGSERLSIFEAQQDPRIRIGFRWLKMKSSVHPEGEIVPYIEKISMVDETRSTKPGPYHLAELGIICAMFGKSKGLLIRVFPNREKTVQVHHITYKNPEEILKTVISMINATEDAEKKGDLSSLPPCPSWMNDNGTCPMMKQCCAKGVKGCR